MWKIRAELSLQWSLTRHARIRVRGQDVTYFTIYIALKKMLYRTSSGLFLPVEHVTSGRTPQHLNTSDMKGNKRRLDTIEANATNKWFH